MSISAYRRQKEAAETPRELECRAFSVVIGKLTDAKRTGGQAVIDACYLNNQLWTALTVDLSLADNPLPEELKARLISLAIWVQRYTPQAMGGAPLDPLIQVNRNILDGLRAQPTGPSARISESVSQLGAV
ncbi:MAG TPA: flagellar biosynthesis regulator FlaF [Stellaceae bacterium]|jgi:flagellar protein FlaF|nr:flagellar biosynthesis regulator FlaF [Stellaceae bacterium]